MISAGRHTANVTGWGLIESESKDNPVQFAIELEVIDGEHAGESITWFGYFSDKAFPYTMEKIRRAGLVGDDLRSLTRSTDDAVPITVKHETYNGETRAKVVGIGGGSVLASKALDAGQAASFAERMKQRIKAFDAKAGSPSMAMAGSRPTNASGSSRRSMGDPVGGESTRDDSDIPF